MTPEEKMTADLEADQRDAHISARLTHVENAISDMQSEIQECVRILADIAGTMTRTENVVNQVSKEVMPTIEALMSHPLLKALNFRK